MSRLVICYRAYWLLQTWRKWVRHTSISKAKRALEKSLFILHPTLQNYLLKVVAKCCDMQEQKLYNVAPEATYTLGAFRDDQKSHLDEMTETMIEQREQLTEFVEEVWIASMFICRGGLTVS